MKEFTSNYLAILKNKEKFEITDGAVAISTITISEELKPIIYTPPKIIYDKFIEKQKLVEPEIKKISDSLQAVRELGFEIISQRVKKPWFKKQAAQYKIRKASLILDVSNVINVIPLNHYIEYDRANKRIKLIGRNCRNANTKVLGATEWVKE